MSNMNYACFESLNQAFTSNEHGWYSVEEMGVNFIFMAKQRLANNHMIITTSSVRHDYDFLS